MRKNHLIATVIAAFVVLVPGRMMYLEVDQHSNMMLLVMFLVTLFGSLAAIGIGLTGPSDDHN